MLNLFLGLVQKAPIHRWKNEWHYWKNIMTTLFFLMILLPLNLIYIYLHELSLPFQIDHYGNNLGSLFYAQKVPADPEKYDPSKSHKLISYIQKNVKQYHSRELKRQFIAHFGLVVNAKPLCNVEFYQF